MSSSLSPRRPSARSWLALVLLLTACSGGEPLPQPQPQPPAADAGTPPERGFTDCGNFPTRTLVQCPPGSFCDDPTFSKCAAGCLSDINCANNQICDKASGAQVGICQNTNAPACSASRPCPSGQTCVSGTCTAAPTPECSASKPCPSGQTCVSGICTTPPSGQCTPQDNGLDGCSSLSLCEDHDGPGPQAPACVAYAACDASHNCPTGLSGAVCNEGYLPNKGLFCIPQACRDFSHCPVNWACVRYPSTQVLGMCNNRGRGAFCTDNVDCLSNKCNNSAPGELGSCG